MLSMLELQTPCNVMCYRRSLRLCALLRSRQALQDGHRNREIVRILSANLRDSTGGCKGIRTTAQVYASFLFANPTSTAYNVCYILNNFGAQQSLRTSTSRWPPCSSHACWQRSFASSSLCASSQPAAVSISTPSDTSDDELSLNLAPEHTPGWTHPLYLRGTWSKCKL